MGLFDNLDQLSQPALSPLQAMLQGGTQAVLPYTGATDRPTSPWAAIGAFAGGMGSGLRQQRSDALQGTYQAAQIQDLQQQAKLREQQAALAMYKVQGLQDIGTLLNGGGQAAQPAAAPGAAPGAADPLATAPPGAAAAAPSPGIGPPSDFKGPVLNLSDDDIEPIGRTYLAEAGNQGPEGKAAVVNTILNRLGTKGFGNSVSEVVNQANAFEPVSKAGGWEKLPPLTPEQRAEARDILRNVAMGAKDNTNGALYFQNQKVTNQRGTNFAKTNAANQTAQIGDHTFYNTIDGTEPLSIPQYRVALNAKGQPVAVPTAGAAPPAGAPVMPAAGPPGVAQGTVPAAAGGPPASVPGMGARVPPKVPINVLYAVRSKAIATGNTEIAQMAEQEITRMQSGIYLGADDRFHADPDILIAQAQKAYFEKRSQNQADRDLPPPQPFEVLQRARDALPPGPQFDQARAELNGMLYKSAGGESNFRGGSWSRHPFTGEETFHPAYPPGIGPGVGPGGAAGPLPGVLPAEADIKEAQGVGTNRAAPSVNAGSGQTTVPTVITQGQPQPQPQPAPVPQPAPGAPGAPGVPNAPPAPQVPQVQAPAQPPAVPPPGVPGAPPEQPAPQASPQPQAEWESYPPPPWVAAVPAGQKLTKLGPGVEAQIIADQKRMEGIQARSESDQALSLNLHQLDEALNHGLKTGKFSELIALGTNLAERVGLGEYSKRFGNATDSAEFIKVTAQLAAELAAKGGDTSDARLANGIRGTANIELPEGANRRIMAGLQDQVDQRNKYRTHATGYFGKYQSLGGGAFDNAFYARNPQVNGYDILVDELKKNGKLPPDQPDQTPMPQGALQRATAKDGKTIHLYPKPGGGFEWR